MTPASPLEDAIDHLYALPLDQFVQARNELARQHGGDEARRVRALAKPNVVAWALNQVYWSSRPVFDRLVEAAARLREAQARGLLGQAGDLRGAGLAHREALAAAVREGAGILHQAGHEPTPDALRSLTAAFEALPWEEPAGRLTRPPEPSGFAVFAGMPIGKASPLPEGPSRRAREKEVASRTAERPGKRPGERRAGEEQARERQAREEQAREEQAREEQAREEHSRAAIDAARREAAAAVERVRAAEERVARARDAERDAREQFEEARRTVKEAEGSLREAERRVAAAETAVRKAEAAKSA